MMAANRLATSGPAWADWFQKENRWVVFSPGGSHHDAHNQSRSGTYNNQWMVVDYKKLGESPRDLVDGVFTVAEQIPGDVIIRDEVGRIHTQNGL